MFWDLSFEGGGRVRKFENVDVCQNDVAAKNCTHHIVQRLLKKRTEHSTHLCLECWRYRAYCCIVLSKFHMKIYLLRSEVLVWGCLKLVFETLVFKLGNILFRPDIITKLYIKIDIVHSPSPRISSFFTDQGETIQCKILCYLRKQRTVIEFAIISTLVQQKFIYLDSIKIYLQIHIWSACHEQSWVFCLYL